MVVGYKQDGRWIEQLAARIIDRDLLEILVKWGFDGEAQPQFEEARVTYHGTFTVWWEESLGRSHPIHSIRRILSRPDLGNAKCTSPDQFSGLCPFHEEREISFSFNLLTGQWKCFAGCGSGNVIGFHAKKCGVSNKEAFKDLK